MPLPLKANTFQFFSRNPRGTKARALNIDDVSERGARLKAYKFAPLTVHAPYIINSCSKDAGIRELACQIIRDDPERPEYLPGNYYNFHPGSHGGQGAEVGIKQICATLNRVLWKDQYSIVLLEAMSGSGTELGGRFEELRDIIIAV